MTPTIKEVSHITEEELDQLKQIQEDSDQMIYELGRLQYQKMFIESDELTIKEELAKLTKKSNDFTKELNRKYGEVTINISTGEITKAQPTV
jgi:hypothetical protein